MISCSLEQPRATSEDGEDAGVDSPPVSGASRSFLYPSNLLDESFDSESSDRDWWLVYTKSRQEKIVAEQLDAVRVPFYLPLITRKSWSRGRPRYASVPLFPGYIFLWGTNEERVSGLKTNRIVTTQQIEDGKKLRLDLKRISNLIATGAPLTPEARMTAGDLVRVKGGPFVGLEGVVLKRRGETRLYVAVECLGQGVSMEINDYCLEPL